MQNRVIGLEYFKGIELDGQIVRKYPAPRKGVVPRQSETEQLVLT